MISGLPVIRTRPIDATPMVELVSCGLVVMEKRSYQVRCKIGIVQCLRKVVVLLAMIAALQPIAAAREVDGTVPLIRGVRNRVYGTLRDSALIVSNGQEERTLTVDHHGHFHAELPEGSWRVIDVAPKDRKILETGQTFTVSPGNGTLKIRVSIRLR